MSSVSTVGLALSLVFGFLFLALVAEVYYLIWWKKRIINSVEDVEEEEEEEDCTISPRRSGDQFKYMSSCWTKPSFLGSKVLHPQRLCSSARMADTQVYEPQYLSHTDQNKNIWFRQFGDVEEGDEEDEDDEEEEEEEDDDDDDDQETLCGPPRALFTIIEETKEDLESEEGGGESRKGSLSRGYSDLILTIETTPYLTPLASPTAYFTPPLTPSSNSFNPLFESSTDVEIATIKSSPPPKFKFLKDADQKLSDEEEEEEEMAHLGVDSENGSFITLIVSKNKGKEDTSRQAHFHGCSSSQVLPVTGDHHLLLTRETSTHIRSSSNPVGSI